MPKPIIQTTKRKCPECGSAELYKDPIRGELFCAQCGLVIEEEKIDFSQEWRAFDQAQREARARTGAPLTITKHDRGLSTEIGRSGVSEIMKLPAKKRATFFRYKKWQSRVLDATERNLRYSLSELKRLVSQMGLPESVEIDAAVIYRRAVAKGLVRGRSMEAVVAAALYTACRKQHTPRTLEEIAEVSGVDKREIGRTYRFICRELGIRILPADAKDFIPRFASELGLSSKAQAKAAKIIEMAREKEITSGKGPTGIAAAALYIAANLLGERVTQRQVADVAGVTEVTIRNRYSSITEKLGLHVEEVEE